MNPIANIKRFLLKTLSAASVPMSGALLDDAVLQYVGNGTLHGDINQARRELERDGLIVGVKDEFDETQLTWSITTAGQHKARTL